MLTVQDVSLDSFQLRATAAAEKLLLVLSGTGDMSAVAPLKSALTMIQADMKKTGLRRVSIDIRSLYLLNSSCIKTFVHFLYTLQTKGPSFPVEFIVDEKLTWQPRALAALKRLAPELVTITITS